MTQPDYDNDLVFRSGGEEYARIDGSGEWKPQTPTVKLEITNTWKEYCEASLDLSDQKDVGEE